MRAPFCPDTMDLTLEDQNLGESKEEQHSMNNEIHANERTSVKKHSDKAAVFGICLESLMGNSAKMTVPFVLSRLCCYIEKHGLNDEKLFHEKEEEDVSEQLKSTFNKSGDAPLETIGSVQSASKLLKSFLQELPEPLIPTSMCSAFVNGMENHIHSPEQCVIHLKAVVDRLPDITFQVLKYLSRFLLRVASHQEMNGMSAVKLGVEFGPILFRPTTDDQLFYVIIKNITNYFVTDYYAIFEDAEISSTGDAVCTISSKSALKSHSGISRKKIASYPSSVMALAAMQPLSVVIPPFESTLQNRDQRSETNRKVPILLIEGDIERTTDVNVFKQMCIEEIGSTREKNDNPLPTRKRKERRLSGDELQQQRSSSEERPSPISEESLEKKEFMRRCSSHEEMKELANEIVGTSVSMDKKLKAPMESGKNFRAIGSYFAVPLDQDIGNRDHSPHPPNPKRREIDSSDFRCNKAQSQKDLVGQNIITTNAISGLDVQGSINSRRYLHSTVDSEIATPNERKMEFDIITPIEEINILTSFENYVDNEMDCSISDDLTSEESFSPTELAAYNCANNEISSESTKIRIPRSASCPIPKRDDENSSDPKEEDVHLSLSWNMLFETEDNEPIRSEHRFSWPLLKSFQDDDTLLSPSVHSLRKSSSYEAPLSPSAFKSYLSYRSSHLDPNVPPSPPVEQEDFGKSPVKEDVISVSIKQLTKKVHSLRKKIKRFDDYYEAEYGYKPSHAEKTNHPDAKKLMADFSRARKELKALKEEAHATFASTSASSSGSMAHWSSSREAHILEDTTNCIRDENHLYKDIRSKPSVVLSYGETLKTLADERRLARRPESVEDCELSLTLQAMTKEQVEDEKVSIQKALLHFESIHGKPGRKGEKNYMRPLYDRYRSIKKLLFRSSFSNVNSKAKESCTELQPILEHETMDFTSPQHRKSNKDPITTTTEDNEAGKEEEEGEVAASVASFSPKPTEDSLDELLNHRGSLTFECLATKYNNSNLHELPISEMLFQQQQVCLEKRRLRKILREFEEEFYRLNGRKVQKEDKAPVEAIYIEYKHIKARIRLLEALVSKHDHRQQT